ncbi:MAG: sulfotransferase domain-containing protein [Saprospiraceae bacterium]
MKDNRPFTSRKWDAAYRYLLWHSSMANSHNLYIAEFPKSGGTWLSQMLSELTDLPFPRNASVAQQPCIIHGHHLIKVNDKKVVHLIRDGRDIMVSAYHYFLLNDQIDPRRKRYWRDKMKAENIDNVKINLSSFIKIFINNFRSGWSVKTWPKYVNHYQNRPLTIQIKYEELNQNTEATMTKLMYSLGITFRKEKLKAVIKKYHFETQTGRKKGEENPKSFLRKGSVNDWKNFFTKESAEVFNFYAGDALIRAGYESNKNWY